MTQQRKFVACLRFSGDDLIPEEISVLLHGVPTLARRKGQTIEFGEGRTRIAKFGQWHLEANGTEPADAGAVVMEILKQLTDDVSIWEELGRRFDVDIFCGWFLDKENEGLKLSPQVLRSLGERGIKLDIDIYGPIN
jgi:hypothetical protein